jgi:3-methyl-2-oxobutanoate hydroxymethyltransferase
MKKLTILDIIARKKGVPLVVLTAYTMPQAKILDGYVDILLVGDSLGMVLYGLDSTLAVTLEMMIAHGAAVVRGAKRALVVVDLPFASYQESPAQAFKNAARVLAETGCSAVKLEGGAEMAETVRFLVARGIPVIGHIGLTPQSVHTLGGYSTQGKNEAGAAILLADAKEIAAAGAFALVLEGVTAEVAENITKIIAIPTIGIGASPACDGQVLVTDDMLGLSGGYIPRFVKKYASLACDVENAVKQYAVEVQARTFPSAEFCYPYKK